MNSNMFFDHIYFLNYFVTDKKFDHINYAKILL